MGDAQVLCTVYPLYTCTDGGQTLARSVDIISEIWTHLHVVSVCELHLLEMH